MVAPSSSQGNEEKDRVYGLLRAPITTSYFAPKPTLISRIANYLLNAMGWKIHYQAPPQNHGLIIFYPHTSNWDFVIGILYKWSTGLPLHFWIKDNAINTPILGSFIRSVGGIGINRRAPKGVVKTTINAMQQQDFFWLAVAPEGTRSYSNGWRTGFYHVWNNSACPLGLAYMDYGKREIGVLDYVLNSGNMQADFAALEKYYQGRTGYHVKQAAPVQPYQK